MNSSVRIRLLGITNNERGELFTRLTKDLFFALGYDNLRLNVHKSGRELDLVGEHRFEPRRVIAECKAQAEKIGGAGLNKFYGALTRERKKSAPNDVAGYFVSLAGFTQTGVEQEMETGEDRLILLDANRVIDELERSRVIVERTSAADRAGQCAAQGGVRDITLDSMELVGHQSGYLWLVFYEQGKRRTHFALIHADGTPLDREIARDVIRIAKRCGIRLQSLEYIQPPIPAVERHTQISAVKENYRNWLGEECGYIYLDGMPADTDLSATRLKLERLFVPLKATFIVKQNEGPEVKKRIAEKVLPIGDILSCTPHLAILAAPGGGKSTLMKRLATAYAFKARRDGVSDNLPKREYLPLFMRCRELRDRAHRPILELLEDVPRHAGLSAEESTLFHQLVHEALHAGHAMLLIDGLDEISEEGARQVFAGHLRTFLAMFPQVTLVVTSREAGFRLVAGVIAGACRPAKLAPLDEQDVLDLCERWHTEVLNGTDKVRAEAKALGQSIWANERIRQLAQNPLLLTTLLVVRRWIGELPRSRAALYREAIRVLVRTWNVEGFAPLDEEETLAQLSYVACAMMEEGSQQIGQKALLRLLQSARKELEAELQFARISPQQFVDRIEYRSSLLTQTGYDRKEGALEPVYEFRHLTFQEYLAARGYVEEQYAGRDSGSSLWDLLGSHIADESWQEVIPLAAVLAGRKAEDLITRLIEACEKQPYLSEDDFPNTPSEPARLLYQCVRDEVQITTPTLRRAFLMLGRYSEVDFGKMWVAGILRGKFGAIFKGVIEQQYLSQKDGFEAYLSSLAAIVAESILADDKLLISDELAASLQQGFQNTDRLSKISAALLLMVLAFNAQTEKNLEIRRAAENTYFRPMFQYLTLMLSDKDLACTLAASWALAWMGDRRLSPSPTEPMLLLTLFRSWRQIGSRQAARYPAWALASQPLLERDTFDRHIWGDCDAFLRQMLAIEDEEDRETPVAALVVGWYRGAPWTDVELVELISSRGDLGLRKTVTALLERLGEIGQRELARYKKEHEIGE